MWWQHKQLLTLRSTHLNNIQLDSWLTNCWYFINTAKSTNNEPNGRKRRNVKWAVTLIQNALIRLLTRWTGWDLPPPALSAWAALSVYIAHIPNGTVKKKKKRTLLESGLLTRAPTCSSMASCLGRREKDRPRRSFTPLRHPGNIFSLGYFEQVRRLLLKTEGLAMTLVVGSLEL